MLTVFSTKSDLRRVVQSQDANSDEIASTFGKMGALIFFLLAVFFGI